MRTIEEFRARHLETLRGALERPAMYGGDATGTSLLLRTILFDLCYIDEREAAWDDTAKYMSGNRGVVGHFEYQVKQCRFPSFTNEVASTYAEVAYHLGYFMPSRLLTADELSAVRKAVEWRRRDH